MEFEIVVDCADPAALGMFWAAALGYEEDAVPEGYASWEEHDRQHGIEPNVGWGCFDPAGKRPNLFFQRVPEPKTGKNRLHLDLKTPDVDGEVERLVALGARSLGPVTGPSGDRWVVMQDPEGNELCVVPAEEPA